MSIFVRFKCANLFRLINSSSKFRWTFFDLKLFFIAYLEPEFIEASDRIKTNICEAAQIGASERIENKICEAAQIGASERIENKVCDAAQIEAIERSRVVLFQINQFGAAGFTVLVEP